MGVGPAEPLVGEAGRLGLGPVELRLGRAVHLAEGVATDDQRDGLLVVHRHAAERLADVLGRLLRVRDPVGALGVDVDQAHLDGGQRVVEQAVAVLEATRVAVVVGRQPLVLGTPVDVVLGRPDVLATEGEPGGAEAHGLQRTVAGEDEQVGPGDGLAVLLLDRQEQATGLVEVAVVGPGVQRGVALGTGAPATATVADPVGPCGVPRHADEERAVVTPVRRPPRLRVRHQRVDVPGELVDVDVLQVRPVVELDAEGRGVRVVLVEDAQVQRVGPPLLVGLELTGGERAPLGAVLLALGHDVSVVLRYLGVCGLRTAQLAT